MFFIYLICHLLFILFTIEDIDKWAGVCVDNWLHAFLISYLNNRIVDNNQCLKRGTSCCFLDVGTSHFKPAVSDFWCNVNRTILAKYHSLKAANEPTKSASVNFSRDPSQICPLPARIHKKLFVLMMTGWVNERIWKTICEFWNESFLIRPRLPSELLQHKFKKSPRGPRSIYKPLINPPFCLFSPLLCFISCFFWRSDLVSMHGKLNK